MKGFGSFKLLVIVLSAAIFGKTHSHGDQPLSKIAVHKIKVAFHDSAYVKAFPSVLGLKGENSGWVTLNFSSPNSSNNDWIGVFSPANFSPSICPSENAKDEIPLLCSSPIKYQFANYSNPNYVNTGTGFMKLQLINQRSDFAFALFCGGLSSPKLVAISNTINFVNPKAPLYPRLAQGKTWDEMTVTWNSGYSASEAQPFVEWGPIGGDHSRSSAGTLTISRSSMCGSPARTVGWRDPGFIHTSFLKELWPNTVYSISTTCFPPSLFLTLGL